MRTLYGDVFSHGLACNLPTKRLLARTIETWMRHWLPEKGRPLTYRVDFTRDPGESFVTCRLRIKDGPIFWNGSACGKRVDAALAHCLSEMKFALQDIARYEASRCRILARSGNV